MPGDKPVKAEAMQTLVLPPSLDPSRLQGDLIHAAANASVNIEAPSNCFEKHLRLARRQI